VTNNFKPINHIHVNEGILADKKKEFPLVISSHASVKP